MDPDFIAGKPLVVFYDSCVPWTPFEKMMQGLVRFADHVFVRHRFSEKICRDDRVLLSAVENEWSARYPEKICLFITTDQTFEKDVSGLGALGTVKVVTLPTCNSDELNWIRASEAALALCQAQAEAIERKSRRKISADRVREMYGRILDEKFRALKEKCGNTGKTA